MSSAIDPAAAPYRVTPTDVEAFQTQGYVTLRGVLSPSEVDSVGTIFEDLMSRRLAVAGKDWGEHTPGLLNVTVFSRYHDLAALGSGELARLDARCAAIVDQLYAVTPPSPFVRDYEQLLRKLPGRPTALFPAHQVGAPGAHCPPAHACSPPTRRYWAPGARFAPFADCTVFGTLPPPTQDMLYWPKSASRYGST